MRLAVATLETDLPGALALGGAALALAEQGRPALLSASFAGDALVLGALQREDTLRSRSPARFGASIARRVSTGIEAQLSGAVLYHALGLPSVSTLFPDASARTLLNRNLRALLRGYAAAGVPLRYFGTEVLALLGRPVALVGYDQRASGAVLIEVFVGLEAPCVVRSALKREPPSALYEPLRSAAVPTDLLARVVAGTLERLAASAEEVTPPPGAVQELDVAGQASSVAVPIGAVEAVVTPRVRLFGDVLASTAGLARVEAAAQATLDAGGALGAQVLEPLTGWALDGARPPDLLAALELAAAAR
jgi:hypothetical protein